MVAPTKTAAELEREVYTHHAKTVYFNGLWKDFLTKASAIVGAIALYQIYHLLKLAEFQFRFGLAYEALSVVIVGFNLLFLHRATSNPLLIFKAVFSLAVLQFAWFAVNTYNLHTYQLRGDLNHDQLPLGAMCFAVTWAADRYMLRNEVTAEQATSAVRDLKKKLK
ncbi:unnamed protein product [Aphanomyces euteiches]|uniref:Uncharacterized protein n=1 Tax=Aphanomyces euteiches TaxID=100861 RepID=A0A6G0WML7_9STRA|nr:hypothetical protein Ae201684_013552 [Aphanomyces euteiches]KAH9093646.1 hypothetical protein Ae201684P_016272 [Aphanomyces euteiches]KAH9094532.1 hypothetical protein LEN26_018275 [Aphanomyces euteiches]KAH9144083.1 hypothetical protein AeRB84_011955 [Aphanomyces euteiches]